jgi:hypothetical protein
VGAIFKSALYNFSRFPVLAFEASNADISFDRLLKLLSFSAF